MYIVDGIAYAGEQRESVKVNGVRPLDGYRLWLGRGENIRFHAVAIRAGFCAVEKPGNVPWCLH